MRNLITLADLSSGEIERIFAISEDLKSKHAQGLREALLPGRVMALLFEKPSLRTRVSFEAGISHLGGTSLFLGEEVGWGSRESMADFARVLSTYVDVIVVRSKSHQKLVELAEHSTCSVINGLTDYAHPCQALSDLYTLRELVGSLRGQTLAYVGDGNNVARSLAILGAMAGVRVMIAAPATHQLEPVAGAMLTDDAAEAAAGADALYTDVWVSMGDEPAEAGARRAALAPYQLNETLLARAAEHAIVLHCLPAHPGEEISEELLYGPRQRVWDQAENRRHAQKALLERLLTGR